uniref:G-protein coupled receptors family 1 profile domain-containing protein n=1 Tax=Meloidogyne enterolobii TaxID=390850 RepID=A0A6V7UQD4_MELEN|nr:unnamed protein product [Meloidogyne enterolobii]
MTDNYNINNTLYTTHINPQFYSDLFLPAFIKWIISLPGIINNLALICVTFREKSLRGPCNLLLALGALFDFFYLFGFTIPFLLALTTINFIPLQTCFYIQAIPLISLFASVNTVLFVGIDRLLNVILSLKYHSLNKPIYFTIVSCGILVYPIYAVSLTISGVWSHPNWLI